jgi:hypothetical protein
MNARVKRVTAAQGAVDEDGLIVVRKLKKRPMFDGDGSSRGGFAESSWTGRTRICRTSPKPQRRPARSMKGSCRRTTRPIRA